MEGWVKRTLPPLLHLLLSQSQSLLLQVKCILTLWNPASHPASVSHNPDHDPFSPCPIDCPHWALEGSTPFFHITSKIKASPLTLQR